MAKAFSPAPFVVFCTVTPTKRNGMSETHTHRVNGCKSIADAKRIIADDLRQMKNTFGGLIDAPGVGGRKYHVFRAQWEEIDLAADAALDKRVADIKSGKIKEGPALLTKLVNG